MIVKFFIVAAIAFSIPVAAFLALVRAFGHADYYGD
jgi:hypothetical protein